LLSTGELDLNFAPTAALAAPPASSAKNANNGKVPSSALPRVNSLAVQPSGQVVIAGSFAGIGSTTQKNLARLGTDGALDATYVPGGTAKEIRTLAMQADGAVILGFAGSGDAGAQVIAKITPAGAVDSLFAPKMPASVADVVDPSGEPVSTLWQEVLSIVVQSDQQIVIGGSFRSINDTRRFNVARFRNLSVPDQPWVMTSGATDAGYSLEWQAQGDGGSPITGFQLSWNGPTEGSVELAADVTSYEITGLTSNSTYEFSLRARNIVGLSDANVIEDDTGEIIPPTTTTTVPPTT